MTRITSSKAQDLLVGNVLAAEILATFRRLRASVMCRAYFGTLPERSSDLFEGLIQLRRFTNILNAERDAPDVRYSFCVLATIEELEFHLLLHFDGLAQLDISWRVVPWAPWQFLP
jgi:hypothetical protein